MPRTRLYPNAAARQAAYRQRLAGAASLGKAPGGPSPPGHTPGYPRWKSLLRQSQTSLTILRTEMETYYESRSEPWQESERGTAFLQRIEVLEAACEALEELEW